MLKTTALLLAVLSLAAVDARASKALVAAAERGDSAEVQRLLAAGDDVNARAGGMFVPPFYFHFGETPLCAAARRGRADVVKLLLDKGADRRLRCGGFMTTDVVTTMWEKGYTPLLVASHFGAVDVIRALLDEPRDQAIADVEVTGDVKSNMAGNTNFWMLFAVFPIPVTAPRHLNAAATAAYAGQQRAVAAILRTVRLDLQDLDVGPQLADARWSDRQIQAVYQWGNSRSEFWDKVGQGVVQGVATGVGQAAGTELVREATSNGAGSAGAARGGGTTFNNPACGCPAGFPVWRGGACYADLKSACQGVGGECGTLSCAR